MIDGIKPPRPRPVNRTPYPGQMTNSRPTTATPFRPPEEVAADEPILNKPAAVPIKAKRKLTRKQLVIILIVAVVLLIGGSVAAYIAVNNREVPAPVVSQPAPIQKVVEPVVIYSRLTGLPTTDPLSKLPVTAVMIENSRSARPQSGMDQAGVVFEAIAEGGITRYMALYQETEPASIGPVRSVRPYYLSWMQAFDASIAHVGGSAEALALIRSANLKDLDQFSNSAAYERVTERFAPHNVYTSRAKLLDIQTKKGFTASDYTGFVRKAEAPATTPTARSIDFAISSALYNVHYDFDNVANTYKRVLAGTPHIDQVTKAQLSPKVVIGMVVPHSIHSNGIHSIYQTIGSGKAYIFQDGAVTEGIWEKTSPESQIKFGDANGLPIGLNPGQTWISAVSASSKVTFKP